MGPTLFPQPQSFLLLFSGLSQVWSFCVCMQTYFLSSNHFSIFLFHWSFWKLLLLSSTLGDVFFFWIYCRGPAWGTLPRAKVRRKEAWHTQRRDQASGNPLFPSIYPQNQGLFYALTYTSDFTGGSPPSPFLSEKELICSSKSIKIPGEKKNSWAWQECFSLRTPLKVI